MNGLIDYEGDTKTRPPQRTKTPRKLPTLPAALTDETNATVVRDVRVYYGPGGPKTIPAGSRVRADVDEDLARFTWGGWPAVIDSRHVVRDEV